ncbi:MerR family transcriptional regulator [Micromonospora sp. NPDC001898]|uniref:MerR family transcriptional regulator n=1 Tax=Micromonospora sp. NPDC001898 TaxID=3364221 RepID=UPI0036C188EF
MARSTREFAEFAGTTVNTIRHYHRLGLLSKPSRRYNGYKQYDVHNLARLVRIRRIAELGVPLARITEVEADGDGTAVALRRAAWSARAGGQTRRGRAEPTTSAVRAAKECQSGSGNSGVRSLPVRDWRKTASAWRNARHRQPPLSAHMRSVALRGARPRRRQASARSAAAARQELTVPHAGVSDSLRAVKAGHLSPCADRARGSEGSAGRSAGTNERPSGAASRSMRDTPRARSADHASLRAGAGWEAAGRQALPAGRDVRSVGWTWCCEAGPATGRSSTAAGSPSSGVRACMSGPTT